MSTADGWDLTVPENDAELAAEFRRHGVRPGEHLRILRSSEQSPELADNTESAGERPRRRLSFTGSVQAEPDLARNSDEYLRGFGEA